MPGRNRRVMVAVGGMIVLAALFHGYLAVRFPLARLYARIPPLDYAKLTGYSYTGVALLVGAYALLFGLLALLVREGLRSPASLRGWLTWRRALGVSGLLALPLLFVYPVFAIDMLMYGVRSRLWLFHGANPFLVPPSAVPDEPWAGLCGEWITATSGYSPLWEVIALLPAVVAGSERFLVHLMGLKVLAGLAYLADVWLLTRVLRAIYGEAGLVRLLYVAWNPLVLLELVGNGHNDGLMLTFVLLAVWFVLQKQDVVAHVALAAAVLVKVTPVFLWPLLWLWGMTARATWQERARYTAAVALILGITAGVFALFLWPDPSPWQALRESDSSSRTLQTLAILAAAAAHVPHAYTRVQTAFRIVFVALYVALAVWLWRRSRGATSEDERVTALIHAWLAALALAVLVFASNWRPWYTTWLLMLAALSPSAAWLWGVYTLSITAATGDVYWTNVRWTFTPRLSPLVAHLVGVPYVFGIPIACAIRAGRWKRRGAMLRRSRPPSII